MLKLIPIQGDRAGTPPVNVSYRWCRNNCGGWQLSDTTPLNQWVGPFVGFLVPAVVFCLAIPRRRRLRVPESLFDITLNEITTHFRTPFMAIIAAVLVSIDTISWLMIIFALSGPILVSGVYEALIDARIIGFLQEKIRNKRLSTAQRANLLYTILVGNLDMFTVIQGETYDDTPLNHVRGLTRKFDMVEIQSKYMSVEKGWSNAKIIKKTDKTKTRLRKMLEAQNSFGVTVGAPVMFFCGAFIYTLIDNYTNLGDNSTSHALAFGMWWMIVPHMAIVSGLLLAGNDPNTLEGIVSKPIAMRRLPRRPLFELFYDSRYRPAWIWQRGRSKKIWMERICWDQATVPEGLAEKIKMNISDWIVIGFLAYSLILIPSVLAFLTSFYTPIVGLSCRSMTFLTYELCELYLTILWIWDIHSTYLDDEGAPRTPVTRNLWLSNGIRNNWQAYVWWPNVIASGAVAAFTAIGGTMMQIMGVFRNCRCQVSIGSWRESAADIKFNIGTNSAEAIQHAATYWMRTGVTAVTFLAFISYVGWWYQRRLRYQFKLLVDRIDWKSEDS